MMKDRDEQRERCVDEQLSVYLEQKELPPDVLEIIRAQPLNCVEVNDEH
jgi:hypothetical protein